MQLFALETKTALRKDNLYNTYYWTLRLFQKKKVLFIQNFYKLETNVLLLGELQSIISHESRNFHRRSSCNVATAGRNFRDHTDSTAVVLFAG